MQVTKFYYHLKPYIPRPLQILLRRQLVLRKRCVCADRWPIDENSYWPPEKWYGWPEKRQFALILTHDVETGLGQDKCLHLAQLEKDLGFRSSFNFVPERYNVSSELRKYLKEDGFEVGVHGFNHDGRLFQSKEIFEKRSQKINQYLEEWGAVGFRSPVMHHNLDWIHELNIDYDLSTYDTDPFEPQSDPIQTIFPLYIPGEGTKNGYIELPYTLAQDFTLFVLLKEMDFSIWKQKLDWIAAKGGMALLNTHPDYMNFNGTKLGSEEYPVQYYKEFLEHINTHFEGLYWHALPCEMARFWSKKMIGTISRPG